MTRIMKQTLILIAVLIFVAVSTTYVTTTILKQVKKEQKPYEDKIGSKVIIEKDTLTVTDYSSVMETFTLSNGTIVNKKLVLP